MNFFALLLLAASCAYGLARWLKLPSLPLLIASGMALNLSGILPGQVDLGETLTTDDDHANAARPDRHQRPGRASNTRVE